MNFKEISSLLNSLFLGYSDRLTHLSVLFNPKLTNKFDIYNNVRIQFITHIRGGHLLNFGTKII